MSPNRYAFTSLIAIGALMTSACDMEQGGPSEEAAVAEGPGCNLESLPDLPTSG